MTGEDARSRLAEWRAQGRDRLDAIGFARIDALSRRAAAASGPVRDLLDARLVELVDAYATRLPAHPLPVTKDDASTGGSVDTLASLLADLARAAVPGDAPDPTQAVGTNALDEIRRLSTAIRTESQVRQALDQAPENAGPLNSANLVHRALILMSEDAPGYLTAFMDYVDTLARLESMDLPSNASVKAVDAAAAAPKRRRRKPTTGD